MVVIVRGRPARHFAAVSPPSSPSEYYLLSSSTSNTGHLPLPLWILFYLLVCEPKSSCQSGGSLPIRAMSHLSAEEVIVS